MPNIFAAAFCAIAAPLCPHKAPTPPAPPPADKVAAASAPALSPTPAGLADTWRIAAATTLRSVQGPVGSGIRARNVILFIGDGMGVSTVTAARILDGQTKQMKGGGEENKLSFEVFPATALAKTYTVDLQVAESAGAMTAIMTGVKTRGASIGVDEVPAKGQCQEAKGHELATLLETAKDAGLAAGIVSTSRITHAVPASTYAHVSDRDWEVDIRMPQRALDDGCRDIARQLVEFDHHGGLDVALGGGRLAFMTPDQADPQQPKRHGVRGDGVDLIAQWRSRNPAGHYVWSSAQLKDATAAAGPVLGLFGPDDLTFDVDRTRDAPDQPSLADMTRAAISALGHSPKGYVLVVDAGGVDVAHHQGNAFHALTDTIALSQAVAAAADMTKDDDTLIVVTADHGHTLTLGGYARRGNPILGLSVGLDGKPLMDSQGRPFTTLSYANGPGHQSDAVAKAPRPPLTDDQVYNPDYVQAAATPLESETHSGEDVPIYARGPGAQWIHGTLEQNVLNTILRAALALPPL